MRWIFASLMLLILPSSALAYIDPGTGATIIGSLWSTILVYVGIAAGAITLFFSKYLSRMFKNAKKK
jgi:uncharacterized membrane protein YdjX (TVP38/TMEM64 family)